MENSVNQSVNYKIAMTGVLGALSVVLSVTPLGYIQIPFISITVMHIPAILAAVLAGLVPGMCVGLIFGVTSLVRTVIAGGGVNPFFLNPMVSILPRILFPAAAWAAYTLLTKVASMPRTLGASIAAAVGTLFNTLLVMGAIYIFYGNTLVKGMAETFIKFGFNFEITGLKGYFAVIAVMELTNGLWEIAGAVIITTAVMGAMFVSSKAKSRLSQYEEEEEEDKKIIDEIKNPSSTSDVEKIEE
ncbi:ECF transporter S component [Treponema sp.]|uniref:ECF transporter S component n=1 Tax=Treponema sp. TaxID=166 RepID=UPI0025EE763E|nr:ECF transporter S component [Treponema sp.]MCR5217258.1 ECF transporter S component [Treponema sp.]